ncbi:MAG: zinc-dependent metalloprotease [Bacteroidota bacterium]|jgi:hypothetical protein
MSFKRNLHLLFFLFALKTYAQVTITNDTIPVVFHVINSNETYGTGTNLDSLQLYSQIKVLNQDFNGVGFNVQNVPPVWQNLVAITGIKFVPALFDPSGNLLQEPGIHRVPYNTIPSLSAPGSGYSQTIINSIIKPATGWPPSLYCNIWVLKLGGGINAYSTFPNASGLSWLPTNPGVTFTDSLKDGIVCNYQFIGDTLNVTAPYNRGRSVTHEMGHWLGLIHFYQGCGVQYLPDLPPGDYSLCYGCPSWPCVQGFCQGYPDGPMFNNFMMYTDDACMNMFTGLQGDTMKYVLHHAQFKNNLHNSWVYHTLPTSIEKLGKEEFKIFPNPSINNFQIFLNNKEFNVLKVVNTVGEPVKFEYLKNGSSIRINSESGVYFIFIESEGKIFSKKLFYYKQ